MSIIKCAANLLSAIIIGSISATAILALPQAALASDATSAPATINAQKAAPPAEAQPVSEKITNPYGLDALWKTGDFVAKGTLGILVIMSMGSWFIIFGKYFEQRKIYRHAREMSKTFWQAKSIEGGVQSLDSDNAFGFIANSAIDASERDSEPLAARIGRDTWLTMQIQRSTDNVQSSLQGGLAFLATVGSTAPFVGLFGTVWGIYHALTAIGIAGQASIDKVAGPVGEALIMTAIGLAVAVPAVLGYNWLVRRNKVAMEKIRAFSDDIHALITDAPSGAR